MRGADCGAVQARGEGGVGTAALRLPGQGDPETPVISTSAAVVRLRLNGLHAIAFQSGLGNHRQAPQTRVSLLMSYPVCYIFTGTCGLYNNDFVKSYKTNQPGKAPWSGEVLNF